MAGCEILCPVCPVCPSTITTTTPLLFTLRHTIPPALAVNVGTTVDINIEAQNPSVVSASWISFRTSSILLFYFTYRPIHPCLWIQFSLLRL